MSVIGSQMSMNFTVVIRHLPKLSMGIIISLNGEKKRDNCRTIIYNSHTHIRHFLWYTLQVRVESVFPVTTALIIFNENSATHDANLLFHNMSVLLVW